MHPIASHPFAQVAAQAALAAQRQDKFLEMNELLLASFGNFNQVAAAKAAEMGLDPGKARSPEVQVAMFTDYAGQLGLDTARFQNDINDPKILKRIQEEAREVAAIGATGTPANFINGRYLRGAQPFEVFKQLVDEVLAGGGQAGTN